MQNEKREKGNLLDSEPHDGKKRFLNDYSAHIREAAILAEEIIKFRSEKMNPSVHYGESTGGGGGKKDLSDYAARLDELIRELCKARHDAICRALDIHTAINALPYPDQRNVLRLRYIHGLNWADIIERMACESSKTYELHRDALENLQIGEELPWNTVY